MPASLHLAAQQALLQPDPDAKCAAVAALREARAAGKVEPQPGGDEATRFEGGRPPRPVLVPPQQLARRKPTSREGHGALLHAIAHIEFSAINLALDCVHRFRSLPPDFHDGWLEVACEEARHFGLVRGRLRALGFDYGDWPAHNGLWEMAEKTVHDPLARMALVPRVLEARGLDAAPPIMAKLRAIGDLGSVAVLEIILRDEIGHVALGDRWFRTLCAQRGLEPEATYLALIDAFDAPRPQLPMHEAARLQAGFSAAELARLKAA